MKKDVETRTVNWCGDDTQIDIYRTSHHYGNQTFVDGFPVNPVQRECFDITPNEDREPLEIEHWWGKPYIVSQDYWSPDSSYSEFVERMSKYGPVTETEEEFNQRMASAKAAWVKAWPTGVRYEVRCLDGGAWDRSSSKGLFSSLEVALHVCNKIKNSDQTLFYMSEADVLGELKRSSEKK